MIPSKHPTALDPNPRSTRRASTPRRGGCTPPASSAPFSLWPLCWIRSTKKRREPMSAPHTCWSPIT